MEPGIVPRDMIPPAEMDPSKLSLAETTSMLAEKKPIPRICKRCKTVKPINAHHCSSCGRCIIRMDHHCPWVNNCVAIMNQKYFLLFLLYTFLCCVYSGVLLVARFISCTRDLRACSVSSGGAIMCILNFIEAIIFGLFTMMMMWDQLTAIRDDLPGIDALQNKKSKPKGFYNAMKDVFGESTLSWRWLLPLNPTQKLHEYLRDELHKLHEDREPAQQQDAAGDDHHGHHHGHSHSHGAGAEIDYMFEDME